MNGDWLLRFVSPFGYRHALLVSRIRVGVGVWLLVLTSLLYGYGRGGRWAALLLPASAVVFYLAYQVPRAVSARENSSDATS